MLQTIFAYIQVVHVSLILYLTWELYKFPSNVFNLNIAFAETALTVIDTFVIRRSFSPFAIFISVSLFSVYLPPHMHWICLLFLTKIIYVNDILASTKKLIFSGDNCSFCQLGSILHSFIRYTLIQYMFLGIVIMVYKTIVVYFDKSDYELPENYVLFYQMMVTATTIGYGDVCPKSRIQMNFFIGAIPFVCGSFVIFGNNVNPLWGQFLQYWNSQTVKQSEDIIQVSSMTQSQKQIINDFARQSADRRRQLQTLKQTYYNDWISIAAINYQSQSQLISTIVDQTFPKQTKLLISSKIRQQYFPKDWVILNNNDISLDLFMIVEGEIDYDGESKSTGFVFNQQGFFCQAISGKKIITKSFVTVWAISLSDLQEVGMNCPKVKDKINQHIAALS